MKFTIRQVVPENGYLRPLYAPAYRSVEYRAYFAYPIGIHWIVREWHAMRVRVWEKAEKRDNENPFTQSYMEGHKDGVEEGLRWGFQNGKRETYDVAWCHGYATQYHELWTEITKGKEHYVDGRPPAPAARASWHGEVWVRNAHGKNVLTNPNGRSTTMHLVHQFICLAHNVSGERAFPAESGISAPICPACNEPMAPLNSVLLTEWQRARASEAEAENQAKKVTHIYREDKAADVAADTGDGSPSQAEEEKPEPAAPEGGAPEIAAAGSGTVESEGETAPGEAQLRRVPDDAPPGADGE